jgi:hypothetical protein
MQKKARQTDKISRRKLGRMMLASLFSGLCPRRARASSAPLLEVDRFVEGLAGPLALNLSRVYRADAVIVLLSLPVYRRSEVGGGRASIEEAARGDSRYVSLQFTGASRPERAAGLDRMGSIREVVVEHGGELREAAYFGVLTSSPEETIEQGKQSLGKAAGKLNEYTAIDGHSYPGKTRSIVNHFHLPAAATRTPGSCTKRVRAFKPAPLPGVRACGRLDQLVRRLRRSCTP